VPLVSDQTSSWLYGHTNFTYMSSFSDMSVKYTSAKLGLKLVMTISSLIPVKCYSMSIIRFTVKLLLDSDRIPVVHAATPCNAPFHAPHLSRNRPPLVRCIMHAQLLGMWKLRKRVDLIFIRRNVLFAIQEAGKTFDSKKIVTYTNMAASLASSAGCCSVNPFESHAR